ncbi:MAG TPA: TIGR03435 family protein, partial [Bryobacteraceae bacterium]|nr:TIGR03435 family protein [Bryobacteraceae bacterium]
TVAKGGAKLMASNGDPNGLPGIGFGQLGKLAARNANMSDFARTMENTALDRPIVDQTGLAGRYDFTLTWVPDEFQFADIRTPGGPPIPENKDGGDLFSAIQEQLGLKLEATKAPAEVIVIDHVEKPSAN